MVRIYNWTINGDFIDAEVEVIGYLKKFRVKYKISTEEMKTFETLPDSIRLDAKRALIILNRRYKKGKTKIGERQVIAWG